MTVPVMVVRALAIDAVPFFASVVTSSLNPFAVFFPAWYRSRGVLTVEGVDALLLERQLFAGFGELRGKIRIRLAVRIQLAGLQRLLHAVEHIAGGGVDVMHGAGHLVERVLRGVQSARARCRWHCSR